MRQMTEQAVEAHDISKRFGAVTAVDGLSLTLEPGTALGLLGPNGAGKSTALAMLTGLRAPDTGEVRVFGHRPISAKARARMGVTPQAAGFPGQLTPRELLHYAQARRGGRAPFDDVVTAFGLGPLLDRRLAGFSGGEVRRLALALAFLGRPGLVFLDEPTAGLDIAAQEAFALTARAFVNDGGALIMTSHYWAEIEAICDRITMIDKGRKVLEGSLADIRARMQARLFRFTLPEGKAPPDWLPARQQGSHWTAETTDSDSLLRRMVGEGLGFHDLTVEPLGLSDIIARMSRKDVP